MMKTLIKDFVDLEEKVYEQLCCGKPYSVDTNTYFDGETSVTRDIRVMLDGELTSMGWVV